MAEALVEFRSTGGRAGVDDHLVVDPDGHATLRTRDGGGEFTLGEGALAQLRATLDQAGFTGLPTDQRDESDRGQEPEPDVVEYTITHAGHTVRAVGSALPDELLPVVQLLNSLLPRANAG